VQSRYNNKTDQNSKEISHDTCQSIRRCRYRDSAFAHHFRASFRTMAGPQGAGIPRLADGKPNLSAPAPRMADGKPDLSGLWQTDTTSAGRPARQWTP